VEEQRSSRIAPVSGLALLTGATALAAIAGTHSASATVLLALLTLTLSHSLHVEIGRQGRRRTRWTRHDTINTAVLATCSETTLLTTILTNPPPPLRAVGLLLTLLYAAACATFLTHRRRAAAAHHRPRIVSPIQESALPPEPITQALAAPQRLAPNPPTHPLPSEAAA
jgi:predicted membrane channel-forming protein YqfA (hemolysin III family)